MAVRHYLTIEEVINKLRLANAGYWEVYIDKSVPELKWSTKSIESKDATVSFEDKAKAFSEFFEGMSGQYRIEHCKREGNSGSSVMATLYFEIKSEIQQAVENEVRENVNAHVGQTELNLRIESLTKDYEIRDLRREVEGKSKIIDELNERVKELEKENKSLEVRADTNLWQRIEKFATVASPYLKAFMAQKYGVMEIPQVSGAECADNSATLNIPDELAERFTLAVNAWASTEPNVVQIIEGIVKLKTDNPAIYEMALSKLV